MADRTSCQLFSDILEHLGANPTERDREHAEWLWAQRLKYDFDDYQLSMGIEDCLVRLGLARYGVDPEYPEDGTVLLFRGDDGY